MIVAVERGGENVSDALDDYKAAWLRILLSIVGNDENAHRGMELAELNGLFDPVVGLRISQAGSADGLWEISQRVDKIIRDYMPTDGNSHVMGLLNDLAHDVYEEIMSDKSQSPPKSNDLRAKIERAIELSKNEIGAGEGWGAWDRMESALAQRVINNIEAALVPRDAQQGAVE